MISPVFQNASAHWLEFIKATKKWTWSLLFGKRNHWLAFEQRQSSVNSRWVSRQPVSRPVPAWGKGHWPPKKVVAPNHDGDIKTETYFPPKDFFFKFYLQDRVLKCTHTVSCLCAQLRGRAILGSVCPALGFLCGKTRSPDASWICGKVEAGVAVFLRKPRVMASAPFSSCHREACVWPDTGHTDSLPAPLVHLDLHPRCFSENDPCS